MWSLMFSVSVTGDDPAAQTLPAGSSKGEVLCWVSAAAPGPRSWMSSLGAVLFLAHMEHDLLMSAFSLCPPTAGSSVASLPNTSASSPGGEHKSFLQADRDGRETKC